jgi:hypothetical protein
VLVVVHRGAWPKHSCCTGTCRGLVCDVAVVPAESLIQSLSLAIGLICLHTPPKKRTAMCGRKMSFCEDDHRFRSWSDCEPSRTLSRASRPASSAGGLATDRSTPPDSESRPEILDCGLTNLEGLAASLDHRQARDSDQMASTGLQDVLALEVQIEPGRTSQAG